LPGSLFSAVISKIRPRTAPTSTPSRGRESSSRTAVLRRLRSRVRITRRLATAPASDTANDVASPSASGPSRSRSLARDDGGGDDDLTRARSSRWRSRGRRSPPKGVTKRALRCPWQGALYRRPGDAVGLATTTTLSVDRRSRDKRGRPARGGHVLPVRTRVRSSYDATQEQTHGDGRPGAGRSRQSGRGEWFGRLVERLGQRCARGSSPARPATRTPP
jgi:hypothetical protein